MNDYKGVYNGLSMSLTICIIQLKIIQPHMILSLLLRKIKYDGRKVGNVSCCILIVPNPICTSGTGGAVVLRGARCLLTSPDFSPPVSQQLRNSKAISPIFIIYITTLLQDIKSYSI